MWAQPLWFGCLPVCLRKYALHRTQICGIKKVVLSGACSGPPAYYKTRGNGAMRTMLFVFNPNTGGGRLKGRLMDILCHFAAGGYEITVHPTAFSGDARAVVQEKAHLYDILVCCGGDGTLNEVVHGLSLCQAPPVLGYIPGGTTNDYASSLRLPRSDMLKAANRVLHPKKVFHCDYGTFNGRVFNYVAAFGAFTDVAYSTPQTFKNIFGYSAYIFEAIQKLTHIQPYRIHIVCDEGEYDEEFIFGMVSNSTSVGGFNFFDKSEVHMDDGVFEVILVRNPHGLAEMRELSAALLTRNTASPAILPLRTKKLSITGPVAVPWTLDGEFGGKLDKVEIGVKHKGLRICI